MKCTWTIIGVRDVLTSFKWCQSLFGQPAASPGHADFGMLLDSDGTVLLCLHEWAVEDHAVCEVSNGMRASSRVRLLFRLLHLIQAVTMFTGELSPPRERGRM